MDEKRDLKMATQLFDSANSEYLTALQRERAACEEERARLEKDKQALKDEIASMTPLDISGGDVLDLNVGGEFMAVKRKTLTQVPGSMLASMFSGRWEHCLERDAGGCVFLDFDPESFNTIVTYLRTLALTNEPLPYPIIKPEKQTAFRVLVEYLGLADTLQPKSGFRFSTRCSGLELRDEARTIIITGPSGSRCAVGEQGLPVKSGSYWKYRVDKKGNSPVRMGIIGTKEPEGFRWDDPTLYCWAGNGTIFAGGKDNGIEVPLERGLQNGDEPIFHMDGLAGKIWMWVPRLGRVFVIPGLDREKQFYMYASLHGNGDSVTLLPVTPADREKFAGLCVSQGCHA